MWFLAGSRSRQAEGHSKELQRGHRGPSASLAPARGRKVASELLLGWGPLSKVLTFRREAGLPRPREAVPLLCPNLSTYPDRPQTSSPLPFPLRYSPSLGLHPERQMCKSLTRPGPLPGPGQCGWRKRGATAVLQPLLSPPVTLISACRHPKGQIS